MKVYNVLHEDIEFERNSAGKVQVKDVLNGKARTITAADAPETYRFAKAVYNTLQAKGKAGDVNKEFNLNPAPDVRKVSASDDTVVITPDDGSPAYKIPGKEIDQYLKECCSSFNKRRVREDIYDDDDWYDDMLDRWNEYKDSHPWPDLDDTGHSEGRSSERDIFMDNIDWFGENVAEEDGTIYDLDDFMDQLNAFENNSDEATRNGIKKFKEWFQDFYNSERGEVNSSSESDIDFYDDDLELMESASPAKKIERIQKKYGCSLKEAQALLQRKNEQ
jgi:hypothetical protein